MVTSFKSGVFFEKVLIVENSGEFVENSHNFSDSSSSTFNVLDYLKQFFSLKIVFSSFLQAEDTKKGKIRFSEKKSFRNKKNLKTSSKR